MPTSLMSFPSFAMSDFLTASNSLGELLKEAFIKVF